MPTASISVICDKKNQVEPTGDIKLCGPNSSLSVRECGSNSVGICFENSAPCTVSTVWAVVDSRLLAAVCFGASTRGMNSHLILGHQVDTDRTSKVSLGRNVVLRGAYVSTMSISPPIGQFSPGPVSGNQISDSEKIYCTHCPESYRGQIRINNHEKKRTGSSPHLAKRCIRKGCVRRRARTRSQPGMNSWKRSEPGRIR